MKYSGPYSQGFEKGGSTKYFLSAPFSILAKSS